MEHQTIWKSPVTLRELSDLILDAIASAKWY